MQYWTTKMRNWAWVALLVIITISLVSTVDTLVVDAITSSQYRNRRNSLNSKADSIKTRLDSLGGDYHNVSSQKDTLEEQQRQIQNEIASLSNLIKETDNLIVDLNTQVEFNKKEIERFKVEISDLTMELQKQQQVSPLQSLIASNNLGEAIGNLFILSSSQNRLDQAKQNLEQTTANLEEDVRKQEELKDQLEATKIISENKKIELDQLISQFAGREAEYAAQIAALKAEDARVQAEATRLDREWEESQRRAAVQPKPPTGGGSRGGSSGGGNNGVGSGYVPTPGVCRFEDGGNPGIPAGYFMRPVNGSVHPTDGFGCPTPSVNGRKPRVHDALDFAAKASSPIYAAASGQLYRKGYQAGGYGHYIVLSHSLPNGTVIYTLYAHMIGPSNVVGNVNKGDTIGYVGMSGQASGFHLHFMIYNQNLPQTGLGCQWGASKCYNPARFL